MKTKLPELLKAVSVIAFAAAAVPLAMLLLSLESEHAGKTEVFLAFATMLAFSALGFGYEFAAHSLRKKCPWLLPELFHIAAIIIGGGLVALFAFFQPFSLRIIQTVILCTFAAAAFFLNRSFYYKIYGEILTRQLVGFMVICCAVSAFLIYLLRGGSGQSTLLVAPYVLYVLTAYAFSANQSNLDYLMQRGKHDIAQLPKKIRYFNGIIIALVILLPFSLSALSEPVMHLLTLALRGAALLIVNLVMLILWLLSFLLGAESGGEAADGGGAPPPLPAASPGNPLWDIIGFILLLALAIFAARKLLPRLFKLIGGALEKALRFIAGFLEKSSIKGRIDYKAGEYYDKVEDFTQTENSSRGRFSFSIRSWRKRCRAFLKKPPSAASFREGYKLMLDWVGLKQLGARLSQTPNELAKSLSPSNAAYFDAPTAAYNNVRYGEKEPDSGEQDQLANSLTAMSKLL